MPISAPGNSRGLTPLRRSAEHGFTLVELMVVVTIIALASAAAVLAIPDPRGRLVDEAERFASRARAAHDSAIVEARPVSVWVTEGGYGFDRRQAGNWAPIADKPLRVERWKDGTRILLGSTGRERVTFDPTGLADKPVDLRLTRERESVIIHVDGGGDVHVDT